MIDIIQGDTLQWEFSFDDYSSDDYDIKLSLRGPSAIEVISGGSGITITKANGDWTIDITASATALWTVGDYWYNVYCYTTSPAVRYLAEEGTVTIKQAMAGVVGVYDGRSHAKIALDAIEAVIEGRATRDQMSYSIQGRSLSLTPLEDLLKFRDIYRREYNNELKAEKIARGEATGRNIKVRF